MVIFKKFLKRNKKLKNRISKEEYKANISLYESTYDTPHIALKLGGLRLTRSDHPVASFLWACLYWFGIVNMAIAVILEVIYMAEVGKKGTFEAAVEIFGMIPCCGYLIMAAIKSYKIYIYRPVFENLINELRDMWPHRNVTKEEYELIEKPIKRLNFINKVYFWCNHLLLAFFIVPHVVDVARRWMGHEVELKLPFFFWLPFDDQAKYVYEVMLLLQSWQALVCVWLILCSDTLFCAFMVHITTQFELLAIRIRQMIYVPTDNQLIAQFPLAIDSENDMAKSRMRMDLYGDIIWESSHLKELNEIVVRHHALIRLSGDVESMFSFQLLVNFIYSSIIICFCGFCCIIVEKWNEFIYKTFLTSALTQTWLFCWYGQRLLDSSRGIGLALYNSGWYLVSKRVRNNILIMLHRAQKHVCITTYGFSVVSLTSYSNIIKTSWSYFTLLLNTYKN